VTPLEPHNGTMGFGGAMYMLGLHAVSMSQRVMWQKELLSLVSALMKPAKLVSLTDLFCRMQKINARTVTAS